MVDSELVAPIIPGPVPVSCPTCQYASALLLQGPSKIAVVNYYRCKVCGTVWTQPKSGGDPITIVAKPPNQRSD